METFKLKTKLSNVACHLYERQTESAATASLHFLHRVFDVDLSHSKVSKRDKVLLNCVGIIRGIAKYSILSPDCIVIIDRQVCSIITMQSLIIFKYCFKSIISDNNQTKPCVCKRQESNEQTNLIQLSVSRGMKTVLLPHVGYVSTALESLQITST